VFFFIVQESHYLIALSRYLVINFYVVLRCYLAVQNIREDYALKRFVGVFRQCKQSLGNKDLQLQ